MLRVLIVDDDPGICESIERALEFCDTSYYAQSFTRGRAALRYLTERPFDQPAPDVVLLDVVMPSFDGYQFRAAQLENPAIAPIPVIVMAGFFQSPRLHARMQAHGYIPKPLRLHEVDEAIRMVLRGHLDRRAQASTKAATPENALARALDRRMGGFVPAERAA